MRREAVYVWSISVASWPRGSLWFSCDETLWTCDVSPSLPSLTERILLKSFSCFQTAATDKLILVKLYFIAAFSDTVPLWVLHWDLSTKLQHYHSDQTFFVDKVSWFTVDPDVYRSIICFVIWTSPFSLFGHVFTQCINSWQVNILHLYKSSPTVCGFGRGLSPVRYFDKFAEEETTGHATRNLLWEKMTL